MAQMNSSYKKP